MRCAWMLVCLSLMALGLVGCSESLAPVSDDASAKSAAVAPAGKTARDVAREAVGAVPQIVNPAEELLEFDPTGLLRWSAVAGADAYEVWAYRDAGLTQAAEFSGALSSRQYQFTQLTGGQSYWIKLYFRANGVWQEAPTFSIKTTANVVKSRLINSQEELEAFGPGGTLRWSAVAGADVYELWIYRDTQLVAFAETSGPVRITQYQITSLTPGTTYYVQVYARVNGQYTAGGALPLTVTDKLDKARIVNPQEELDAFATNGLLRWSPVTGATAYELWIFTNPNSSEIHESSGSLTTRSYQVRTLQPGKVYYAQAYALVNGQWQVGAPVRITTTATPTKARLSTPQEQLEGFATNGTLRWAEVPGATAYELWIYSNAGLGQIVESGANADRSYTTRRLCSGATYYVQVYALVNGVWTTGWATRLDVTQGTSAADCIPPAPQITLKANPLEVLSGDSVTLTWASRFATSCTGSGAWSGAKAPNGQETVGPVTKNSLFTLTCTGQSGSYRAEVLVTMSQLPIAMPGAAQNVVAPVTVQLDGTGSRASRGGPVSSYDWTLRKRPAGSLAKLTAGTTARPTFNADEAGEYEASLVVGDGTRPSAAASVGITAVAGTYDETTVVLRVVATGPSWGQEPVPGWPRAAPVKTARNYRLFDLEIARDAAMRPARLNLLGFSNEDANGFWSAEQFAAIRAASTVYSAPVDGTSAALLQALITGFDTIMAGRQPTRVVIAYSGHGSPSMFFEGTLTMSDGRSFVRHVRESIGDAVLVLDFSTNCNVAFFDFAVHFHDLADYLVASDLAVGGFVPGDFNAWLQVQHDGNLHRFFESSNSNVAALSLAVAARQEVWRISSQSITADRVHQSLSVFNLTEFLPLMRALKAAPGFDPLLDIPANYGSLATYVYSTGDARLVEALERFRFRYVSNRDQFAWSRDERGLGVVSPASLKEFLQSLE